MSTDAVWASMQAKLERAGQAHVLQPPPPDENRAAFLQQLQAVDLDDLPRLLQTSLAGAKTEGRQVEPFPSTPLADLSASEVAAMRRRGLQMIANGEVAALLLAGGQGTRLGTSAPKGCYDIGLPSGKSLFQYHCEKIRSVKKLAAREAAEGAAAPEAAEGSARLPLLVMTSDATDAETRAFFGANGHFGLPPDDVIFFQQGMLPCLTPEGKLLLDSPGVLATAPNGNGGVYVSLRDSGALQSLEASGVRSVFQFGVDNILCHVAEPTFLGFCAERGADCAAKTVAKRAPHEPVGVVATVDGAPAVVEYSEITKEMAEGVGEGGRLHFGSAHICVNYFSVPFLRTFCEKELATLPLHVARKKIPHTTADGQRVSPDSPNGIKLELFIFDTFRHAKSMVALEVPRDEEFAPVKNPPGAKDDSPDTARQLINALSRKRVTAAGGHIEGDGDAVLEVSPLLSYAGEGLEAAASGKTFTAPAHLPAP